MGARSGGPLGHERVDGHPIGQLSLLDRALLRKYSVAALLDGLPSAADKKKVQSERDDEILREEESQSIVEQVSAEPLEKEVSMVSATCTDFTQMHAEDHLVQGRTRTSEQEEAIHWQGLQVEGQGDDHQS